MVPSMRYKYLTHPPRCAVQIMFELCRFRNAHPAFNGTFELLDTIQDIRDSILIPAQAEAAAANGGGGFQEFPTSLESQDRIYSQSGTGGGAFGGAAAGNGGGNGGDAASGSDFDFSGEGDFLTDVVGASVDILASLDSMDLGDPGSDWCACACVCSPRSGASASVPPTGVSAPAFVHCVSPGSGTCMLASALTQRRKQWRVRANVTIVAAAAQHPYAQPCVQPCVSKVAQSAHRLRAVVVASRCRRRCRNVDQILDPDTDPSAGGASTPSESSESSSGSGSGSGSGGEDGGPRSSRHGRFGWTSERGRTWGSDSLGDKVWHLLGYEFCVRVVLCPAGRAGRHATRVPRRPASTHAPVRLPCCMPALVCSAQPGPPAPD